MIQNGLVLLRKGRCTEHLGFEIQICCAKNIPLGQKRTSRRVGQVKLVKVIVLLKYIAFICGWVKCAETDVQRNMSWIIVKWFVLRKVSISDCTGRDCQPSPLGESSNLHSIHRFIIVGHKWHLPSGNLKFMVDLPYYKCWFSSSQSVKNDQVPSNWQLAWYGQHQLMSESQGIDPSECCKSPQPRPNLWHRDISSPWLKKTPLVCHIPKSMSRPWTVSCQATEQKSTVRNVKHGDTDVLWQMMRHQREHRVHHNHIHYYIYIVHVYYSIL